MTQTTKHISSPETHKLNTGVPVTTLRERIFGRRYYNVTYAFDGGTGSCDVNCVGKIRLKMTQRIIQEKFPELKKLLVINCVELT